MLGVEEEAVNGSPGVREGVAYLEEELVGELLGGLVEARGEF